MNVTVFGATGAIGRLVVSELLTAGHTVTAHARNPAKVPATWPNDVRLVIGKITDAQAIDEAVTGADAVISALGPSMDRNETGLPLVEGTRLIVDAMKRHDVTRFIGNATPGVIDKRDKTNAQQKLIGFLGRTMFPRADIAAFTAAQLTDERFHNAAPAISN